MAVIAVLDWMEPAAFLVWLSGLEQAFMARKLTFAQLRVLKILMQHVGPEGLYPSDATIAKMARCCVRTVQRAREKARDLGILTWQHTRKVTADGRWRQGPNSYTLTIPAEPAPPGGHFSRERKESKIRCLGDRPMVDRRPVTPAWAPQEDRVSAQAAVAAVAAAQQARIAAGWARRASPSG